MQTGACHGDLISNGTVVQIDDENAYASWGLTHDGRWAFGTVTSGIAAAEGVVELISGFVGPLLVDHGSGVHSDSALVAQRNAVGVDDAGRLLFLTVAGSETPPRGMNISELGDAFAALGAITAVNLDGGGSTTLWLDGAYVVRPTCEDTPVPECERAVASIVCVMPGAAN